MKQVRPTPADMFAKSYLSLSKGQGEDDLHAFEKVALQRQTDERALAEWRCTITKLRANDGSRK